MAKNTVSRDAEETAPSVLIDRKIGELGDWRGDTLARIRALIKKADPDVTEEVKWRGVPVWEHAGILCTGETYKTAVKMTFAKGASLDDPAGLFNASLEGNTRRAIDFHEGDAVDEDALVALVRAAVALNVAGKVGKKRAGGWAESERMPQSFATSVSLSHSLSINFSASMIDTFHTDQT